MPKATRETVPPEARMAYDAVLGLLDAFAEAHLTEEYRPVLHEATLALARKRPSPLTAGRPASWAAGIAYAIGAENFLFDKTTRPYLSSAELAAAFGVGASTVAAKAAEVRKRLQIRPMDPRWCVASMLESNPVVWMLSVDGFVVDIRHAPIELQRAAFAKGLIPFVPGDRGGVAEDEA
jgi:Domain of unknown function (DUF6398)